MAEKLKSISRQIHWSLLAKAAAFALAWLIFPFWLFLPVALCLYFFPLFQTRSLDIPFLATLILAFIHPQNILFAILLFGLFLSILLIKNLLLIDRKTAYEFLVFALSFLLLRDFYGSFNRGVSFAAVSWGFLLALFVGMLLNSFITSQAPVPEKRELRRIAGWLSCVVMWQLVVLGLFLPLDFVYQSIIVFLFGIVILDLVPEYYFGLVSREKLFLAGITTFVLLTIVLVSARWGLL